MLNITSLILLTTLSPAQLQQDNGQGRRLKLLPVSDLLLAVQAPRPPRLGRLSRLDREENSRGLLVGERFVCLEGDFLQDLVRSSIGEAADEISMVLRDRTLVVSGAPKHVLEVEQTIGALRRAMTQRFAVVARLHRIDTTREFPATATAAEVAEWTTGLPLLWSGRATTVSGQQIVLSQEKLSHYVWDVDVEVSEESSIGVPKTTTMFEGIRLVVESHALIGSTDRVFKCQFAIGEKDRDIQMLSTGVSGMATIGIPYLRASSGSFSGRVDHDGALLVSIQSREGAGSNLLLVVQAGTLAGPTANEVSAGRTLLLPISALTSPSLQYPVPLVSQSDSDANEATARGGYWPIDIGEMDAERGEHLVGLLRESLGELLEQDDSAVELTDNGFGNAYIMIRGDEKLRTQARKILATIQNSRMQTVETRIRTELQKAPQTNSTFTRIDTAASAERELLHALTFPSLLGHEAIVFKGMETAVLRDYHVEIAKKAAISNPVVQTIFSGIATGVRPTLQDKGIGADLRVFIQHVPKPELQPTAQAKGGDLYHVHLNRAQFRHTGALRMGATVDLGWGPHLTAEQHSLRMHQTVRFRKR